MPDDAALLARIGAETFYHTFRPYNTEQDMQTYLAQSYSLQQITSNLHDPEVHYFLCEKDDTCVGYIKLVEGTVIEQVGPNLIELEKIYVHHLYFGTEAAKMLMQKALDHALELGFTALYLGVWQENKRALAFYAKHGFETVATRQFRLGDTVCDDFIMMKLL